MIAEKLLTGFHLRPIDPRDYQIESKIATIVPIAHLEETVGDEYFMALTHLADDARYMKFYQDRVAEGKFVILDNSTVELGHPEAADRYLAKAIEMGATEILLPDWLHDRHRTLAATDYMLSQAASAGYRGRVMAIPQGASEADWLECAVNMLDYRIDCLGISRRYTNFSGARRIEAVLSLWRACQAKDRLDVRIHLLGCAGRPELDVAPSLILPIVQGVDSSLAAVYTAANRQLLWGSERPRGAIDFSAVYDRELLRFNISRWKHLCTLFH